MSTHWVREVAITVQTFYSENLQPSVTDYVPIIMSSICPIVTSKVVSLRLDLWLIMKQKVKFE